MLGLRPNTRLDFLRRRTLAQVCFGPHDLQLHFDENTSISIESSIALGEDEKGLVRHRSYEEVSRELLCLLNKVVIEVSWKPDGTVTLVFGEGSIIQIYDDNPDFESFTIASPTGLIVV